MDGKAYIPSRARRRARGCRRSCGDRLDPGRGAAAQGAPAPVPGGADEAADIKPEDLDGVRTEDAQYYIVRRRRYRPWRRRYYYRPRYIYRPRRRYWRRRYYW